MRIVPAFPCDNAMPVAASRRAFGIASLDTVLGGGLTRGHVHEIYAAEADDAAASAGFAVAMVTGLAEQGRSVLWLRARGAVHSGGTVQASGCAELGCAPDNMMVGVMPDAMTLLRTAVDALRCGGLGGMIVESRGAMRELDLTASRRLTLAAERSGVPLFLLRPDASPVPSAAQTRWQVAAAPSHALPGNAPGWPTFDVTLLRQRSGPCGLGWRLEWDRDRRMFREAALSGVVVSLPADRSVAHTGTGSFQPAGRRAA